MLVDGLKKLNAGLATIAKESGWPLTVVADNGGISSNDRPVALCSESERWRAQASIQLTLGAITGSKVVVLDRADMLDGTNTGVQPRSGQDGGNGSGQELPEWDQVAKTGMALVLLCTKRCTTAVGYTAGAGRAGAT